MIKELIKEEVNKNNMLLESPVDNRIDKLLTEKLNRILTKKK